MEKVAAYNLKLSLLQLKYEHLAEVCRTLLQPWQVNPSKNHYTMTWLHFVRYVCMRDFVSIFYIVYVFFVAGLFPHTKKKRSSVVKVFCYYINSAHFVILSVDPMWSSG